MSYKYKEGQRVIIKQGHGYTFWRETGCVTEGFYYGPTERNDRVAVVCPNGQTLGFWLDEIEPAEKPPSHRPKVGDWVELQEQFMYASKGGAFIVIEDDGSDVSFRIEDDNSNGIWVRADMVKIVGAPTSAEPKLDNALRRVEKLEKMLGALRDCVNGFELK